MPPADDLLIHQRSRTGAICLVGTALSVAVALINYWPAVVICSLVVGGCLALPGGRRYLPLFVVIVSLLLPIPWPLPAALAIVAFCVFRAPTAVGISREQWFRRWDRTSLLFVAVLAVLVGAICSALVPVAMAGHYMYVDISAPPWWQLAALVIGAAVVNSATGELIWRGMLWSSVAAAGLRAASIVAVTAGSFGLSHWQGYPGGWIGVAAATLLGVVLGWLRLRTSSLLAPFAGTSPRIWCCLPGMRILWFSGNSRAELPYSPWLVSHLSEKPVASSNSCHHPRAAGPMPCRAACGSSERGRRSAD